MALNSRDVPISRDVIHDWLKAYDGLVPIRTYLAGKLNDLGLNETEVNTEQHESLSETTSLLDMIVSDLPSYADALN